MEKVYSEGNSILIIIQDSSLQKGKILNLRFGKPLWGSISTKQTTWLLMNQINEIGIIQGRIQDM